MRILYVWAMLLAADLAVWAVIIWAVWRVLQ